MTFDVSQLAQQLITNAVVQGAFGTIIVFLAKLVFDALVAQFDPSRKATKEIADLNAFVAKTVRDIQKTGILNGTTADEKLLEFEDAMTAYFKEKGIEGDAANITMDYARQKMELILPGIKKALNGLG